MKARIDEIVETLDEFGYTESQVDESRYEGDRWGFTRKSVEGTQAEVNVYMNLNRSEYIWVGCWTKTIGGRA